jgi:hypothetical protein
MEQPIYKALSLARAVVRDTNAPEDQITLILSVYARMNSLSDAKSPIKNAPSSLSLLPACTAMPDTLLFLSLSNHSSERPAIFSPSQHPSRLP